MNMMTAKIASVLPQMDRSAAYNSLGFDLCEEPTMKPSVKSLCSKGQAHFVRGIEISFSCRFFSFSRFYVLVKNMYWCKYKLPKIRLKDLFLSQ